MIVIDTDVLIDAGRGVAEAVACLREVEASSPAVSVITQMELMIGCRNKAEMQALETFLVRFRLVKLDEGISEIALTLLRRYRLSHGLLIADAPIASTALKMGASLLSKNQRDYRFIEELKLLPYPRPLT